MLRILNRLFHSSRNEKNRRRRSHGANRPEQLEDRCLLAAVAWDGGGATSNWSDALNWDNDLVPATGDDVSIDLAGSPYTVNLNVNIATGQTTEHLNSFTLNSADVTLNASGRTFTVNGASNAAAGSILWDNSLWTGTGTLTTGAGLSIDMRDTGGDPNPSEIASSLVNHGDILVRGFDNEFSGSVVNETTGSITVQTENSYGEGSQLTLASGMTNRGTVTLHSQKTTTAGAEWNQLTSNAGTIVNEAGGLIATTNTMTASGLPTIPQWIEAEVNNQGTMTFGGMKSDQRIRGVSVNHQNSGLIEAVGTSGLLIQLFDSLDNSGTIRGDVGYLSFSGESQATSTLSNSGTITSNGSSFNMSVLNTITSTATGDINVNGGSGTLATYNTFNNSGSVNIPAGQDLTATNGTINNAATGTLDGDGVLTLNNVTFDVAGSYSNGNLSIILSNSVVQGAGTFVNDGSVDMRDTTTNPSEVSASLINSGSILVRGFDNEFSGSVVNEATGSITIHTENSYGQGSQLTLASGMTNRGTVTLHSQKTTTAGAEWNLLTSTAGTIVNEVGGLIATTNTMTASGLPTIPQWIEAEVNNQGTMTFGGMKSDQRIRGVSVNHQNSGLIEAVGTSGLLIQLFDSLGNSGTIRGDVGYLSFSGESQATSTLSNSGTITSNGSSFNMSVLNNITNTASGDINVNGGSGTLATYNTFDNSGSVDIPAGQDLTATNGTINNAATGTVDGDGELTLNNVTFDVAGTYSNGNLNVILSNSVVQGAGTFVNDGSVDMRDITTNPSEVSAALVNNGSILIRGFDNEFSGSVVNESTGAITIQTENSYGQGSQLTLAKGMTNRGTVTLHSQKTTTAGAEWNQLTSTAGTIVNEVGGLIETTNTMTASGLPTIPQWIEAEIDNQGTITFGGMKSDQRIRGVSVNHQNSGLIEAVGTSGLLIQLFDSLDNSGDIRGDVGYLSFSGESQATSSLSNSGTITSNGSSFNMSVLNNITNTASGDINVNGGSGTLATYNTFNNSGSVDIPAGQDLTATNGTINNAATGTVDGDGALTLNNVTFDVAGTYSTGNLSIILSNSVVQGAGTFVNDGSVDMRDVTTNPSEVSAALVNNGSILIRGFDNEFSGSVVNEATGTITIQTENSYGQGSQLTLASGMTNHGTVTLHSQKTTTAGLEWNLLTSTAGTIVNEVGGLIATTNTMTASGLPTIPQWIEAEVNNQGTMTFGGMKSDQRIRGVSVNHQNSGLIEAVGTSGLLIQLFDSLDNSGDIRGDVGYLSFSGESQATSTLTNSGTITSIGSSFNMSVLNNITNTASGNINVNGGSGTLATYNTFDNSGSVDIPAGQDLTATNGTINNAATGTLDGDGVLTLNNVTFDVAGSYSNGNLSIILSNSVVQGAGTFVNDGSVDMRDTTTNPSEVSASLINNGSILVRGFDNEFSGSVVNEATGSITIHTENSYGQGSQLTLTSGMTNRGTITLHSQKTTTAGLEWNLLTSTAGTIVNEAGGLIETTNTMTASGLPTIPQWLTAEIDNQGTITFGGMKSDQRINGSGANHINTGLIEVVGASAMYFHLFDTIDNFGLIDAGVHPAFFSSGGTYTNQSTGDIHSDVHARFNTVTSVSGVGTINTNVDAITSTVAPGLSPGVLNVAGDYLQNTNSRLSVEIGGNSAGNGSGFHDQVNVTGSVTIGSNVTLTTAAFGGYVPVGGDSYVLINNDGTDAVIGTFAGLTEGAVVSTDFLGSGETATITYVGGTDSNDVVINIVDITPPLAPSTPDLDTADDSGVSNTDDLTNVTMPTFSGTAEPSSTVELFSNVAGSLGTVLAHATTGAWAIPSTIVLVDGSHDITATATDTSSNTSPVSAPLTVTIDTSAPATPSVSAISDDTAIPGDGITSDNTLIISGTADANSDVSVFIDAVPIGTATANGAGIWSFDHSLTILADGTYNITATSNDAAGNVSGVSAIFEAIVDATPPAPPSIPDLDTASDSGISATDDITAVNTPSVSGTAEPGSAVNIFDGAVLLGTTTADGSGSWTFVTGVLIDGTHALTATATDAVGNTSAASAALSIVVDTVAPTLPGTPDLNAGSDTGISNTDDLTAIDTPTVSGVAEGNSVVRIFDGAVLLGSTNASPSGSWSFSTTTLVDGVHSLQVDATDPAGNTSGTSSPLAVTIDTLAPATPNVTSVSVDSGISGDGITNDNTLIVSGSAEANSTVEVFLDGSSIGTTAADGSGIWSFDHTSTVLSDGTYSFTAESTDDAGNASVTSPALAVTIDTAAPLAPSVTSISIDTGIPNDGITSDNTLIVSGTAEANSSVEVFLDSGSIGTTSADGSGNWSFDHTTTVLADGTYSFTAESTDDAGNTSATSPALAVTIDTAAPLAPSVTTISIDTGIPNDGITSDNTLIVSGTAEANSAVEVFLDGGSIGTTSADGSGNWSFDHTTTVLADGTYGFTAESTDDAGNTSATSPALAVTIDTAAPLAPSVTTISINTGIPNDGITSDNTLIVSGTAEANSAVEVFLDGGSVGTTSADGSGNWSFDHTSTILADGTYSFTAESTDDAGNTSATSPALAVTIDTAAPLPPSVTTISVDTGIPNDGITSDNTLIVSGTAEANSDVEVFLDGGSIGITSADGSGNWSFDHTTTVLADGTHSFTAESTDAAGNTSLTSPTLSVTVDTMAPLPPTVATFSADTGTAGDGITSDNTLHVSGAAEAGCVVEVFLNGSSIGTTSADGSGNWSFDFTGTTLADGVYSFTAASTDIAGNTSLTSPALVVTVDTTAPGVPGIPDLLASSDTGASDTDDITADNTPTISGTAEPDTTITVFDGGLSIGTTTADATGNWDFTASALADGIHAFSVTSTDAAGNVSATSGSLAVAIDTVAPDAPVITSPTNGSTTSDVTPDIIGTAEINATIVVFEAANNLAAGAADGAGNWNTTSTTLANGSHTIAAHATDLAGNQSPNSAAVTFTIQTGGSNEAPEIITVATDATLANKALPGDTVNLTASFSDPNASDTHTATIDWGDGTSSAGVVDSLTGTITGEHVYTTGGLFTATVQVTDNSGANDTDDTTAVVTGVRITADGVLQIVGTSGKDIVKVLDNVGSGSGGGGADQIKVVANFSVGDGGYGGGADIYLFDPSLVTFVHIVLCDGNDQAMIGSGGGSGGGFDLPALIEGGAGNDHLVGGRGNDILIGGAGRDHLQGRGGDDVISGGTGRDQLSGGRGNDVLLGGDGGDRIYGGKGEDLLVSDIWEHEETIAALDAIRSEWARDDVSYYQRRKHLTGALPGGNNGTYVLNNTTLIDDCDTDKLKGNRGRDLFFATCQDWLWDRRCSESVFHIH